LGRPSELAGLATWAHHARHDRPAALLAAPDLGWGEALTARGVTGPLRHRVLEPFLAGVLGESEGTSSHRFVQLLARAFISGRPSLPWRGMQAVPDQLVRQLRDAGDQATDVRLGVTVESVRPGGLTSGHGEVSARAVVVATDPGAAADLLGLPAVAMRGLTTFWHVTSEAPTESAMLHLDGDRKGPAVNSVVISNAVPSYSPDGRALVASTVLGDHGDPDTERATRRQLERIYGVATSGWELLTVHPIACALTAMPPPLDARRPVRVADGLLVAGDHRDTASIQGALVSGRRAADEILADLGRAPPPATA
jgi:phytoene dehydrogenase-like protein